MQGEIKERWEKLCEQAAVEQDSEKLMELTTEINTLLDAKEQRLHDARIVKLPDEHPDDHAA